MQWFGLKGAPFFFEVGEGGLGERALHAELGDSQMVLEDAADVLADRAAGIGMVVEGEQAVAVVLHGAVDVQKGDGLGGAGEAGAAGAGGDLRQSRALELAEDVADDDRMDLDAAGQEGGGGLEVSEHAQAQQEVRGDAESAAGLHGVPSCLPVGGTVPRGGADGNPPLQVLTLQQERARV